MDEFVLTLFQGPDFPVVSPVFGGIALLFAGFVVRGLVTGRMGSERTLVLRAARPREFRRALIATSVSAAAFLALAVLAARHPDAVDSGIRILMPLLWLGLVVVALRRGFALLWDRAEHPRLFLCGIAMMLGIVALSAGPAIAELRRLL